MAILQTRRKALKSMLETRRDEVQSQIDSLMIQRRRRDDRRGYDSDLELIQEDIEFALMQMKAGTLERLINALNRLEQDAYGNCYECHGEIAEARLIALPFATKCKECEEKRVRRERSPLFS